MVTHDRSTYLLCLILIFGSSMASAQSTDKAPDLSITNPEALIKEGVPFRETARTFSDPKFTGLQKRYKTIDGIIMVGITNDQGEVLLKGPESWGPPGGAVKPGEDWAAAARRTIQKQAGVSIMIDEPVLVERMIFNKKGSEDTQFSAYILHFEASLAQKDADLTNQPKFRWFSEVPEQAHPNHIQHIKLYLE